MIIFVLTYAILALLSLSLVGSTSAKIPKPSAKVRFQPHIRNVESRPSSLI
jgi:hypothetical protein